MKNLNRKGFTLIELLAVIVVLAIVLVVTIPAVLSSMEQARQKQFENAVATVEEYMQKQIAACRVGDTSISPYDEEIFYSGECVIAHDKIELVVKNAGYSYYGGNTIRCENANNNKDFCYMNINGEYGFIDKNFGALSPKGSKFNEQCYATDVCD